MALPKVPLATGTVNVAGTEVPIRALSRTEVIKMRAFVGTEDEAEPYVVAWGTDVPHEDAAAWLNSVPTEVGGALIEAIFALTGLVDPEDPRVGSTGAGPTAEPSNEP